MSPCPATNGRRPTIATTTAEKTQRAGFAARYAAGDTRSGSTTRWRPFRTPGSPRVSCWAISVMSSQVTGPSVGRKPSGRSPSQSLRTDGEHDDEHGEHNRDRRLRDPENAERLRDADQQGGDKRTAETSEPSDDDDHECEDDRV